MPGPRHTQIDIHATPYYPCITRCVRRAFLCGEDRLSGRCFDHRKAWLVEQLAELTDIFAIDLCAYAVLSNHYQLVTHLDRARAEAWSDDEVVERYGQLFAPTVAARTALPPAQVAQWIACWRARLADLSWFMRCLNEAIARRANAEDACTGRFWEGRFRSQALLDEAGLLTCMAYVDLNPIRAGLATSLCDCDFTSIQQRLREAAPAPSPAVVVTPPVPAEPDSPGAPSPPQPTILRQPRLRPFAARMGTGSDPGDGLPLELPGYIELLTATGASLRSTEPTARLPDTSRRLLERLGVETAYWLESLRHYHRRFFAMVGAVHSIDVYCARTDRSHAKGRAWAARAPPHRLAGSRRFADATAQSPRAGRNRPPGGGPAPACPCPSGARSTFTSLRVTQPPAPALGLPPDQIMGVFDLPLSTFLFDLPGCLRPSVALFRRGALRCHEFRAASSSAMHFTCSTGGNGRVTHVRLLVVNEEERLEQLTRQLRKLEDMLDINHAPEAQEVFAVVGHWLR